jgi:hypothetical protein
LNDAPHARTHRRPRAFADADRRDVGGFDQGYLEGMSGAAIGAGGDQAGSEPTGRTAPDDHDVRDRVVARCFGAGIRGHRLLPVSLFPHANLLRRRQERHP